MSGLVDKVKETVRSRSKHRKSLSKDTSRTSNDSNRHVNTGSRNPSNSNSQRNSFTNQENPAWHVSGASRRSLENSAAVQSNSSQTRVTSDSSNDRERLRQGEQNPNPTTTEVIPPRNSSLRPRSRGRYSAPIPVVPPLPSHGFRQSTQNHGQVKIPDRTDSLPTHKREAEINNGYHDDRLPQQFNDLSMGTNTSEHRDKQKDSVLPSETEREMIPAPLELSKSSPRSGHKIRSVQARELPEHLRLPQGFNMGSSEKTVVDTQWNPAVTRENIYPERTEIIQEAITRDIHVHHYFTYVQPIKVVEVLPAKHYQMDVATGKKIEIPAPAGWQMPADLKPRPVNTSMLKATTRHYMVDAQHPNGIPEPPPTEQQLRSGIVRMNGHAPLVA